MNRYRVVNSGAVADQFRGLIDLVRGTDRESLFVASATWVVEELSRTPAEFGESSSFSHGSRLSFRRGFAGPLFVQYAIDEDARIVYLRRFVLRR